MKILFISLGCDKRMICLSSFLALKYNDGDNDEVIIYIPWL